MQKFSSSKVIFFLSLKLLLLVTAFAFSGCGNNNPLDVDVSSITVPPVKIKRFDQALFDLTRGDLNAKTQTILNEYGDFYEGFLKNLVCPGGTKDSTYTHEIIRFVTDKNLLEVYHDVPLVFSDLGKTEKEIQEVYRHYNYYFHDSKLPVPVAAFTGFNYNIAVSDSLVAFSLEMYLGKNSKFYEMAQFPMYKRMNMNPENLVPDFVKGWMMDKFPDGSKKNDLMSAMIYQGKIIYLVDAMLPGSADSIKIGFTQKQLDWCGRNASNVWGFLLKNQLLYSTSAMDIAQFTNEGPFTTGFVKESPARTGVWLGWQIVKSYMKKNKNTSLDQLMKMNDAQALLDASGFKPN